MVNIYNTGVGEVVLRWGRWALKDAMSPPVSPVNAGVPWCRKSAGTFSNWSGSLWCGAISAYSTTLQLNTFFFQFATRARRAAAKARRDKHSSVQLPVWETPHDANSVRLHRCGFEPRTGAHLCFCELNCALQYCLSLFTNKCEEKPVDTCDILYSKLTRISFVATKRRSSVVNMPRQRLRIQHTRVHAFRSCACSDFVHFQNSWIIHRRNHDILEAQTRNLGPNARGTSTWTFPRRTAGGIDTTRASWRNQFRLNRFAPYLCRLSPKSFLHASKVPQNCVAMHGRFSFVIWPPGIRMSLPSRGNQVRWCILSRFWEKTQFSLTCTEQCLSHCHGNKPHRFDAWHDAVFRSYLTFCSYLVTQHRGWM